MADGGGRQAYHDATVGPPSLRIARREGGPRLPVVLGVPLAGGELSARRCSSCWSVANGAGRCEARRVRGRRGAGECGALIEGAPAIALEGSKGVGKTVSAARRAVSVVALDDPMQRDLLDADPDRLERGPHPILLDEWQRFPRSWDLVRRSVDANRGAGRFLLTGSAVPPDVGVHTGAGRIVTLRSAPSLWRSGSRERRPCALRTSSRVTVVGSTDAHRSTPSTTRRKSWLRASQRFERPPVGYDERFSTDT